MPHLRTFLRGAATALSLLALGAAPAVGAAQKFLRMPDVRQVGEDGAGIAALQAVFAYYGLDGRQDVLRQRLTERGGSPNDFRQIVRVANEYGLKATVMSKMTEQQLRDQISKGFPVIVACRPGSRAAARGRSPTGHGARRTVTGWSRWATTTWRSILRIRRFSASAPSAAT